MDQATAEAISLAQALAGGDRPLTVVAPHMQIHVHVKTG